jgi:hypothetical protein
MKAWVARAAVCIPAPTGNNGALPRVKLAAVAKPMPLLTPVIMITFPCMIHGCFVLSDKP